MFMNRELPAVPQGNPMASTVQVRGLSDLTGARRGALLACRWRSRMAGA